MRRVCRESRGTRSAVQCVDTDSSRTIVRIVLRCQGQRTSAAVPKEDAERRASAANGGDGAAASQRLGAVHIGRLRDGGIPAAPILDPIPAVVAASAERRQAVVAAAAAAAILEARQARQRTRQREEHVVAASKRSDPQKYHPLGELNAPSGV